MSETIKERLDELEKKQEIGRKLILKQKAQESVKKLQNEFKKSTNTAIVAAFSFLIALAWRDVITAYVDKVLALSPFSGALLSTIVVTIISSLPVLKVVVFFL